MKLKSVPFLSLIFMSLILLFSCTNSGAEASSASRLSRTVVGDYALSHSPQLRTDSIQDTIYIYFTDRDFVIAECDLSTVYREDKLTGEMVDTYFENALQSISLGNYSNPQIVSEPKIVSLGNSEGYRGLFSVDYFDVPIYWESIVFLSNGHFSTITFVCDQDDYSILLPQFLEMLDSLSYEK